LALQERKIAHYRILKEIGSGGLGQVFKAIDEQTGRTVAVKVLHQRFQTSKKYLAIFHRELLIFSRLKNKHIVEFLDANFQPPNCYIVTEFVDGWSLHHLMKVCRRFPPLVALSLAIDMLQGIDYLHLHDMIHSDLSSPNVLVDKVGRVLVADFGLAAQEDIEDYKHYMIGTPGYYSPEHVSDSSISTPSDIYCVGLLIYEMLAGMKAVVASKNRREVFVNMKKIDLNHIVCADRKMQSLIRKVLKSIFRMNPRRRPTSEILVFEIYKILRRYEIRYARYAVAQYLIDQNLAPETADLKRQQIYYGYEK